MLLLVMLLLVLAGFRFLVIGLLFDFLPLNQIDQDIHRKYTLSSDAELILIRSLTLGKVTSKCLRDVFEGVLGGLLPPVHFSVAVVRKVVNVSPCFHREGNLQRGGHAGSC